MGEGNFEDGTSATPIVRPFHPVLDWLQGLVKPKTEKKQPMDMAQLESLWSEYQDDLEHPDRGRPEEFVDWVDAKPHLMVYTDPQQLRTFEAIMAAQDNLRKEPREWIPGAPSPYAQK